MDDGTFDTDDGSLSLHEAAAHYHRSERTIMRWIKDGKLQAYKVDTPRGDVWRILLDSQQNGSAVMHDSENVTYDGAAAAASSPDLDRLVDLVDRLQRDNQQLAGQLGFVQAQLQHAQERIKLLEAPKDEDAPPSPWWKRLLGG